MVDGFELIEQIQAAQIELTRQMREIVAAVGEVNSTSISRASALAAAVSVDQVLLRSAIAVLMGRIAAQQANPIAELEAIAKDFHRAVDLYALHGQSAGTGEATLEEAKERARMNVDAIFEIARALLPESGG